LITEGLATTEQTCYQLQQGFFPAPLSVCVLGMVMVRLEGPSPLFGLSGSCF
jgi:hypothetical protein